MAASAGMVAGNEWPRLFAATPIHPMYMYKRRQEINKEIHRFIVLQSNYFLLISFITVTPNGSFIFNK
jgi:hypothetical protein